MGAHYNAIRRGQERDNDSSQSAINFGAELYNKSIAGEQIDNLITKGKAKGMQTSGGELDDVNLWPNPKPAPDGFSFPEMSSDFETLRQGDQSSES